MLGIAAVSIPETTVLLYKPPSRCVAAASYLSYTPACCRSSCGSSRSPSRCRARIGRTALGLVLPDAGSTVRRSSCAHNCPRALYKRISYEGCPSRVVYSRFISPLIRRMLLYPSCYILYIKKYIYFVVFLYKIVAKNRVFLP